METKVHNWVWKKNLDCITKSDKSNEHGFCTLCSVDISFDNPPYFELCLPPYSSLIFYADIPNFSCQVGISAFSSIYIWLYY